MFNQAVEIIKVEGKASTSFLQRKLQIGYNRAARIIDMMEEKGIVSKANHVGKREVLKKIFLTTILFMVSTNLPAIEKNQIINQLNGLNSLEFTFNQFVNEKKEKGSCLLKFPGKLKCNYFDNKEKGIIINNKKLAITQKRYNKTYRYPISKSPFLNILYKERLLENCSVG